MSIRGMKDARETVAAFVLHVRARASTAARIDVGSMVRFCVDILRRGLVNPRLKGSRAS